MTLSYDEWSLQQETSSDEEDNRENSEQSEQIKEISLPGAFFSLTGVFLIPIVIEDQVLLGIITNSIQDTIFMGKNFHNDAMFGFYKTKEDIEFAKNNPEDPYPKNMDFSDSMTISDREIYGDRMNRDINIGGILVQDFRFMCVKKISGKSFDDAVLTLALAKYQNIIGLCRPPEGLLSVLKRKRKISHSTLFIDMTEMHNVSDECRDIRVSLGRKDLITPPDYTVSLYSKSRFQSMNYMELRNLHIDCLKSWGEKTAVVKILQIFVEKPDGIRQSVMEHPCFGLIDLAMSRSMFYKNTFVMIRQALKSSRMEHPWFSSELWTDGFVDVKRASHITTMPPERCPKIIIYLETKKGGKMELVVTKDQYLRCLPEYTIVQQSQCLPRDRVIKVKELQLAMDFFSPAIHPNLCVLGNHLFSGKGLLIDYDDNSLYLYEK